jgi:hypothetical protein
MGLDTVKLVEMQGVAPRLENKNQSREEANIWGFKAEFAVARLLNTELPIVNVATDGGVDLWFDDVSIDVKFTNKERGPLIFDSMDKFQSDIAVLVGRTEEENTLRVNGWVGRGRFEREAETADFGYGPRLKMAMTALDPIESLWRRLMARRLRYNKNV